LQFPKGIIYKDAAVYTPTGHVIFIYKKESDQDEKKLYIGVINDDGTSLKEIWSGIWKEYYKYEGIRLMPFDDNKRVLLEIIFWNVLQILMNALLVNYYLLFIQEKY